MVLRLILQYRIKINRTNKNDWIKLQKTEITKRQKLHFALLVRSECILYGAVSKERKIVVLCFLFCFSFPRNNARFTRQSAHNCRTNICPKNIWAPCRCAMHVFVCECVHTGGTNCIRFCSMYSAQQGTMCNVCACVFVCTVHTSLSSGASYAFVCVLRTIFIIHGFATLMFTYEYTYNASNAHCASTRLTLLFFAFFSSSCFI